MFVSGNALLVSIAEVAFLSHDCPLAIFSRQQVFNILLNCTLLKWTHSNASHRCVLLRGQSNTVRTLQPLWGP